MKIFIDANILFMASVPGSATIILFDAALKYTDECVTNPHALEEARRNIANKKPSLLPQFRQVSEKLTISNAFYSSLRADLPSQDIPVLAGAIGSRCTHLWSLDKKYFGKLYGKTIHGVNVVSPIVLADVLGDIGWVAKKL